MKAKQNLEHSIETVIEKSAAHGAELMPRIDYLDGWRGVAIVLVLIGHFDRLPLPGLGRLGVDIFFVLSGMLMSNILFTKRTDLKTFYKRRISRILPAFTLYVSVVFTVGYFYDVHTSLWEWISTLTFMRTYFPLGQGIWDSPLPIGHLWSLNVEEHSYILMSLVAVVMAKTTRIHVGLLLILVGIGSQAISYVYGDAPSIRPDNYPINTECALVFIFYSAGYNQIKHLISPTIPGWLPLLTFLIAAGSYYNYSTRQVSYLSPVLLAFTVNHLSEVPQWAKRALSLKPLRLMGIWSYSIYLWQQPFYEFYRENPLLVYPVLAIAVGLVSFYLVENPSRQWINNHWNTSPSKQLRGATGTSTS